MSQSKMKISYQGLIVTATAVEVHFAVGNGVWLRHQRVRVPLSELLTDEVTQALDRHVRRRMLEIWSEEPIPDLFQQPPWREQ